MHNIIQYLQLNPIIFFTVVGTVSLLIGSFLNVVIVRLPIMVEKAYQAECEQFFWEKQAQAHADVQEATSVFLPPDTTFNLFMPRSRCPKCNHVITMLENIPLISFIFLKGLCRHCKQPISLQYPIIEALTAILSLLIAWRLGIGMQTILALLFAWILITQACIDLKHTFIPDEITTPAIWLGLISNCYTTFSSPIDAIAGAVFGYLALWIVYWLFKLITNKEGIGHGDFKLLAMLGAWLGWQYLPLIILLSSTLGTIVGITLILTKKVSLSSAIPFGPYLAIAGITALLYGKEINALYWLYALAI